MNVGKYALAALIRIASSPFGVKKIISALLLDSEFANSQTFKSNPFGSIKADF